MSWLDTFYTYEMESFGVQFGSPPMIERCPCLNKNVSASFVGPQYVRFICPKAIKRLVGTECVSFICLKAINFFGVNNCSRFSPNWPAKKYEGEK